MRRASFSLLIAIAVLASACTREDGRAATSKVPTPEKPAPEKPAQTVKAAMSPEEAAAALPGFPMEALPSFVRDNLISAAQDEFVFDGSPYTLAGCLREDLPCKANATRGLQLLRTILNAGASRSEALTAYNRYYRSFEKAQRQTIDLAGAACRGPADAPVTVVEFSDFECPHCAAARPVLERLQAERSDLRLCFMHFPLPGHSNASSAAQATVFAQRHGKFWELHDLVFENQQRLSVEVIKELVAKVGLDPQALVRAVKADELSPIVDRQKAEGIRLGLQGTPSIFINGRKHELPLMPELLRFTIDDELRWSSNGGKWAVP
ncbi:DsbA family protein [Vulgatibacter incomptus]|uniref:Na+/H+ antiporter, NhaA family protein n=1 Tax=Vulgatibacter incomptus TaxID=1391653 RepID=A0A0K1P8Z6_9BACT|nr:thioredoxin domain-containing protein [Vulgatibacter incomptus]AKU90003.1 Na+/H+ antiporter, NhaA family protein [Vulgatibacter incomptus]